MSSNLEKALSFKLEAFNFLYVLCNYETLLKKNISLKNFVDLCKKKDVKIIQYRDKISSLQEQKTNLLYLKSQLNIPIIINDKIELIEFADGLHLGQEDLEKIYNSGNEPVQILTNLMDYLKNLLIIKNCRKEIVFELTQANEAQVEALTKQIENLDSFLISLT